MVPEGADDDEEPLPDGEEMEPTGEPVAESGEWEEIDSPGRPEKGKAESPATQQFGRRRQRRR